MSTTKNPTCGLWFVHGSKLHLGIRRIRLNGGTIPQCRRWLKSRDTEGWQDLGILPCSVPGHYTAPKTLPHKG